MPKDDVKLNLRLPPAVHARMKALAAAQRRSLNDEIIMACEKWIATKRRT